ncbi:MAG: heavy-metal-associated domain-containing protein [Nitrospina sp.]|jgi:copper chaperone|nr:heavy-metal-associated domain-containing protein [Nitrospina sp.]
MMKKILKVEGMTCQHCVDTVTEQVSMITGVTNVMVSLEEKKVSIEFEESQTQLDKISNQIIEAGFEVVVS